MKTLSALSALLIASAMVMPAQAFAQGGAHQQEGWSFSAGVGGIYSPTYLGDDDSQLMVVPDVRVAYEDTFFASMSEGVGYNVVNSNGLKVGPIVKYDFGRDEDGDSSFAVSGDDTRDLVGIGDVDGSVEVGAYVEYELKSVTSKIEVRQGLGGHEGLVGDASVRYGGSGMVGGQRVMYSVGPELTYTDGSYNEAYFGVNATQSAASGLAQYNADDGALSYGVGANLIVPHTERISTVVFAGYTELGDTIADSSLVKTRGDEGQTTLGLFVNYSF